MKLDVNNFHINLVMSGLLGMVENEYKTPEEAFEIVDEIKKQMSYSLHEIHSNLKIN